MTQGIEEDILAGAEGDGPVVEDRPNATRREAEETAGPGGRRPGETGR